MSGAICSHMPCPSHRLKSTEIRIVSSSILGSAVVAGCDGDGKSLETSHHRAEVLHGRTRGPDRIGVAKQRGDQRRNLYSGQSLSGTSVRAIAEGQMVRRIAPDVERVGIGIPALVPVSGAEADQHTRVLGN